MHSSEKTSRGTRHLQVRLSSENFDRLKAITGEKRGAAQEFGERAILSAIEAAERGTGPLPTEHAPSSFSALEHANQLLVSRLVRVLADPNVPRAAKDIAAQIISSGITALEERREQNAAG